MQKFIKDELKSGMELKLIKCPENTEPYVTYRLVAEEFEYITLGYTSKKFAKDLEQALKKILKINKSVYYKIYPNTLIEIYVDEITTCISSSALNLSGAKVFGDIKIWNGISITGFAKVDKDIY